MDSIKITLETLYDILRNEKKKGDLQELKSTFFIDVVSYLREKQALQQEKEKSSDIFASGERDKLEYELRSIKRILKEIYELREKKIIDVALNRSKTGSEIIDASAMLREEKEFYERILLLFNNNRRQILLQLFKGELPEVDYSNVWKNKEGLFSEDKLIKQNLKIEPSMPIESKILSPNQELNNEATQEINELSEVMAKETKTKIKFVHATPSFVWKDLKVYGPYDIGEETEMFPEVAELLVRKKRAERV